MVFKKVVIAGGGVLGSQIAFQAAYCGLDVTVWLRSEGSVGRTLPKIEQTKKAYEDAIELMASPAGKEDANWSFGIADRESFDKEKCLANVQRAHGTIKLELDMAKAVADADIVIESVVENAAEKIVFYKTLAPLLSPKTILVTNSSTLLPSTFAKYTGRPDKFLSLHFANAIWKNITAEIMAQGETSQESFLNVMEFASLIRMMPLPVNKEKSGYLLNSMLVPFLLSGLDLYVNGVSDPESIDKAWVYGTGSPRGPFRILDVVGLKTAYNIVMEYQKVPGLLSPLLKKMLMPYNFKGMAKVLKDMMDQGKLGKASGEGFYKY
ncbi:MAG: 3-hydroxyacyl-CoA dehydrogenase [Bacteroidales bacterium]|nr:3-hydroxyacyl-CoA dehydrogenase [Bacteroidales bacterium]